MEDVASGDRVVSLSAQKLPANASSFGNEVRKIAVRQSMPRISPRGCKRRRFGEKKPPLVQPATRYGSEYHSLEHAQKTKTTVPKVMPRVFPAGTNATLLWLEF